MQASVFAEPQSINPNRTPRTKYLYGDGSSK